MKLGGPPSGLVGRPTRHVQDAASGFSTSEERCLRKGRLVVQRHITEEPVHDSRFGVDSEPPIAVRAVKNESFRRGSPGLASVPRWHSHRLPHLELGRPHLLGRVAEIVSTAIFAASDAPVSAET